MIGKNVKDDFIVIEESAFMIKEMERSMIWRLMVRILLQKTLTTEPTSKTIRMHSNEDEHVDQEDDDFHDQDDEDRDDRNDAKKRNNGKVHSLEKSKAYCKV